MILARNHLLRMLSVLSLIDMVMISNLLIIAIVGAMNYLLIGKQ